jgi:protein-disulfide isomerase
VIGASAKGLSNENPGSSSALITEYQNAPQVFLPVEAVGGPSSKGTNAPVMDIVEFADFQCPGCRMGSQFLRPFLMKHGDKVRLTYRNFPLDGSCNSFVPNGGHTMACASARHAICAGQQGKFWEMHDMIFDNQESLSVSLLGELVGKVGLDQAKLETCLKDSSTESTLQKDIQWGDLIQLESTPTLIVNGRKLVGAHSPTDLEALLQMLEKERSK